MGLRSAERAGTARVAIVGAETVAGGRIREALAERRVPGRRVDLYGTLGDEAVLSEYAGEARLIQSADPEEVADHDVIFLCEPGAAAERIVAANGTGVLIDLVDATNGGGPPLLHLGIHGDALPADRRVVAVPGPIGLLLADLLHPLHREFEVRRATAVVLRPASDFGEAGVEELRQQTVRLLNFVELPKDVFGRQLAFNVIPHKALAGPEPEPAVSAEVERLLGWTERRLALRLVTVPVFYGHAVSLHVRLGRDATVEQAARCLAAAEAVEVVAAGHDAGTPLEAAGRRRTVVSELCDDGCGGLAIWSVAGEAAAAAAEHAVRLAGALVDL